MSDDGKDAKVSGSLDCGPVSESKQYNLDEEDPDKVDRNSKAESPVSSSCETDTDSSDDQVDNVDKSAKELGDGIFAENNRGDDEHLYKRLEGSQLDDLLNQKLTDENVLKSFFDYFDEKFARQPIVQHKHFHGDIGQYNEKNEGDADINLDSKDSLAKEPHSSAGEVWPISPLIEHESCTGDLAFLLTAVTLPRSRRSLIDASAEQLASDLRAIEFESDSRQLERPVSASFLIEKMKLETWTAKNREGASNLPVERIRFKDPSHEEAVLATIWQNYRREPPWRASFLRWLLKLGQSPLTDLRIAAGRAGGRLCVLDLEYFQRELIDNWAISQEISCADTLGALFTVMVQAGEGRETAVATILDEWAQKHVSIERMTKVGLIASGPFGQRYPKIALRSLQALLKSRRYLGYMLAVRGYAIFFAQRRKPGPLRQITSDVLQSLTTVVDLSQPSGISRLRFRAFLSIIISLPNAPDRSRHSSVVPFLRVLGDDPDAVKAAAQLFLGALRAGSISKIARERLRLIVRAGVDVHAPEHKGFQMLEAALRFQCPESFAPNLDKFLCNWRDAYVTISARRKKAQNTRRERIAKRSNILSQTEVG